jgi:hypothetical protein
MKTLASTKRGALVALVLVLALCLQAFLWYLQTGTQMKTVPVTIDNFIRAETDRYFKQRVVQGCLGRFCHDREPTPVERQPVVRMNRDTPYSIAVFDLTTPVTIVKPDTQGRFQSIMVFNQDHYIQSVIYEPGTYTFTQEEMGTRYILVNARTFVNPNDPKDIEGLHKAQDGLKATQESSGSFEVPDWDRESLDGLRKTILTMAPWVPDSKRMFGRKDEVSAIRHFIGTAGGFAGNREQDALYLNVVPKNNDGGTAYTLTVGHVPVDGFWSVIVYNQDGFFEGPADTISVNNVTAKKNADGTTTIHFGGDPGATNHLRIMPGWNYMVRLYRPRAEVLDGSWKFPTALPATGIFMR